MYDYMLQFEFTDDAWLDRARRPRDDSPAFADLFGRAGGRLVNFFYSFSGIGEFAGGVAVWQSPTIFTSIGSTIAAMAPREFKSVRYTRLNSLDECLETLEKAAMNPVSPPGTWRLPEPRSTEPMLYDYMFQFAYTPEAWARHVMQPQNPAEPLAVLAEQRNGRLTNFFYTFGANEGLAFLQASRLQTCLAIVVAATATGDYRDTRWTRLISVEEGLKIMETAGRLLAGETLEGAATP